MGYIPKRSVCHVVITLNQITTEVGDSENSDFWSVLRQIIVVVQRLRTSKRLVKFQRSLVVSRFSRTLQATLWASFVHITTSPLLPQCSTSRRPSNLADLIHAFSLLPTSSHSFLYSPPFHPANLPLLALRLLFPPHAAYREYTRRRAKGVRAGSQYCAYILQSCWPVLPSSDSPTLASLFATRTAVKSRIKAHLQLRSVSVQTVSSIKRQLRKTLSL